MKDIVLRIKEMFIKEAIDSPLLFNDLANMEKYISESYSGRSLIELLQNADDAGAKKFYLKRLDDNTFVVANDGRVFTDDDMMSLCRSGASTKYRDDNMIGYRGIGFKSVVNYAETVYLFSGDIKASFSKELTSDLMKDAKQVPLIRIPHEHFDEKYMGITKELIDSGYNTVFIFETKDNIWEKEVLSFDSSCMIFLSNICVVNLCDDRDQMFTSNRVPFKDGFKVMLNNESGNNEWYVINSNNEILKSSIAFKLENDVVVEAEKQESIVHCFMPTLNTLSMPMKINGDFSTDPSRTRITIDEYSISAIKESVLILYNLIKNIIDNKKDSLGIIKIIKKGKEDPLSSIRGEDVNDILCKMLKEHIMEYVLEKSGEKGIYLQPNGMNDEDYKKVLDYHHICGIGSEYEKNIPGITELLLSYGVKPIPPSMSVDAMKSIECSDTTKAAVVGALVNESKLGISKELKEDIQESKIFKFESGESSINEAEDNPVIDSNFEGSVLENATSHEDYSSFMKRIGLKREERKTEHTFNNNDNVSVEKIDVPQKQKSIKKWRSVEKNVAEVLRMSEDIIQVDDVSKQNLGYDLEATLEDGSKRFYEVKSVDVLSDSFSITNNEYTTANDKKNDYYLAIANMTERTIEVCFIKNPIFNLKFIKRVTRWEWLCDNYDGETIKVTMSE